MSDLITKFIPLGKTWTMSTSRNPTGYGPRKGLVLNGDEAKYKLWKVKFSAFV